jgi:hypothetical protein
MNDYITLMDSVMMMEVHYIDRIDWDYLDKIDYYKGEFVLMVSDEMNLVHNNQQ